MRATILKIRSVILFGVLSCLSAAVFSSRASAQMTDSIGKLIPGVYLLKTGSPYAPFIEVEIFNNSTYRLELYKMGASTARDIHHLFEGRIVRNSTSAGEPLYFELRADAVWRVTDQWTGLFSPFIESTTLMQEPSDFSRDLSLKLRIENPIGVLGGSNEMAQVEIRDATAAEDFLIFATRIENAAKQPKRISDRTFARFDVAPRDAIGTAAQTSYACQQLFRAPSGSL